MEPYRSTHTGTEIDAAIDHISEIDTEIADLESGKSDVGHVHSGADITSGTVPEARLPTAIDAAKIANGSVSNAEFQRLDGVTSAIQTQLDAKLAIANNLSEIASAANRTAARSNLDVLWSDDARAFALRRTSRGGVATDAGAAYRIVGTSGINLGTQDFSIAAITQLNTYTSGVAQGLIASHSTGNNRVELLVAASAGNIQLRFTDGSGVQTSYTMTPDVTLVTGSTYLIAVTVDRDGLATLYINGMTDRDKSGAGVTVSVSGSSAVDIGNANANAWGMGLSTQGPILRAWIFNQILSAAAVQLLAETGDLILGHQSGSLTAVYTSDFSVDANGFVTHTDVTPTGNNDGISDGTTSKDNTLKLTTSTGVSIHLARKPSAFTSARDVRITGSYYVPSGLAFNGIRIGFGTNSAGASAADLNTVGTWTTFSIELKGTGVGDMYVSLINGTATTFNGVSGQAAYLKDLVATHIGALIDPDLHLADPSISTTVYDNALGANHGTMTFCTQVRKNSKLNVGQLCVGASTVLKKIITNTAALDFGSINAATSADLTITVTGALVGDSVALGCDSAPTAGIIFWAFVSATNTVTVRATNITAGAIDPTSRTFRATVFQF